MMLKNVSLVTWRNPTKAIMTYWNNWISRSLNRSVLPVWKSKTVWEALFIRWREIPRQKVSQLVLQTPSKNSIRSCVFIKTSGEEKLSELVKSWENLRKLSESSTDTVYRFHRKRYFMRTFELSDISQAEWHSQYDLMSKEDSLKIQSDDEVCDES